jgi:hypothetical protein
MGQAVHATAELLFNLSFLVPIGHLTQLSAALSYAHSVYEEVFSGQLVQEDAPLLL